MKKGISYWSFKGGLEGTAKIEEVMEQAKLAGFDSIELCIGLSGELTHRTSQNRCEEIYRNSKRIGIEISSCATGFYWEYPLSDTKKTVRAKSINWTKQMMQVTRWLHQDTLLVVPGAVDVFFNPDFKPVPYDDVYKLSRQSIVALIPAAKKYRVVMALENVWNKFLLSPLEMKDFVDSFKSHWVQVYFDAGNVLLTGYPEHWITILNKRIRRVHWKDYQKSVGTAEGFCDLMKGDLDFKSVLRSLRKVGYNRYITAEMIPYSPGLIQRTGDAMQKIWKM